MTFKTILADPPWDYKTWGPEGKHKSPDNHYRVMDVDAICSLPVRDLADKNAVLLMWTTNPFLASGAAHRVVEAWGFKGKSLLTWGKLAKKGGLKQGTGYHARCCSEPILVATRGNPRPPTPANRKPSLFLEPVARHSQKPDLQYGYAESYEGPYLELFARDNGQLGREGWVFLGNEITGNDIAVDLERLKHADYWQCFR